MDNYSDEFSELQKRPNEELQDCCDKLFELFNMVSENAKKKAAVWPLQMMLLVLCPVIHTHVYIYKTVQIILFFRYLSLIITKYRSTVAH
jgi:hypothetical protein